MEARVDNNEKNKQRNKEKKRKKRTCTELYHRKLEELEKILEKKELNMNSCPWLNTQVLGYFAPSK